MDIEQFEILTIQLLSLFRRYKIAKTSPSKFKEFEQWFDEFNSYVKAKEKENEN